MTTQQKRGLGMLGVALPFLIAIATWTARNYDASKLDTAIYALDQVRDSAWKAGVTKQLSYVACRQDRPRVDCLK